MIAHVPRETTPFTSTLYTDPLTLPLNYLTSLIFKNKNTKVKRVKGEKQKAPSANSQRLPPMPLTNNHE